MEIKRKILIKKITKLLDEDIWIWPMKTELSFEIEQYVEEIQSQIAVRVKNARIIDLDLRKFMKEEAGTLIFRILAVQNISLNTGSKTPGIDNKIISNDLDKIELCAKLSMSHLEDFKASPVKRVYIPKPDGKTRSIGILSIFDRCVQELFRLVLDPAIDPISDPDSYGFRKSRNCHMALGRLQNILRKNPSTKVVIDADIKGFFDNINHDWIIQNFPMPFRCEHILIEWLKSEIYDKDIFIINDSGVPQGGIISPLIANFTLNGIENAVFEGTKKFIPCKTNKSFNNVMNNLIRYADDFVIVTNTMLIIPKIIENLNNFLMIRGLTLNKEKTQILELKEEKGFDYLGYTFQYFENPKISAIHNRADLTIKEKLFIYPSRDKVLAIKHKIKETIAKSKELSAYQLIKILNPVIMGWANYFSLGISAKTLSHLDNYIYQRIWVWITKKHPKTSKHFLAEMYLMNKEIKSPIGRKWHFFGQISNNSTLEKRSANIVFLKLASHNQSIVCPSRMALPIEVRDGDSPYISNAPYLEHKLKTTFLRRPKKGINDQKRLYNLQKGLCEYCGGFIENLEDAEIHHIKPINIGGTHKGLTNKSFIHKECHTLIHNKFGNKQITFLPFRNQSINPSN